MMQRVGVLVIGVLLAGGTAFAQDTSRGEFSVGWRDYHVGLSGLVNSFALAVPNDYPKGWYADVSVNLSPKFALVGEAGGAYHNDDTSQTSGSVTISESAEIKFHTFMGGVRVRAPQIPWFVPFGQVLFGGERDTSRSERTLTFVNPSITPSTNRQETSSSNPVLGLDGGVTIAGGVIGVRASVGYVRFFKRADADAFRVNLGAVVRF